MENNGISVSQAFQLLTDLKRDIKIAELRCTTAESELEKCQSDVEVLENRFNALLNDIVSAQDKEKEAVLNRENENLKKQIEEYNGQNKEEPFDRDKPIRNEKNKTQAETKAV